MKISNLGLLAAFTACLALSARPGSAQSTASAQLFGIVAAGQRTKNESFDRDPGWESVNSRIARSGKPRQVRQDFGYSAGTNNAGGIEPGEVGGYISPDGQAAFYGRRIEPTTLERPLAASGTLSVGRGRTHLLLGFFNSQTVNEWRTPNTIALRINCRGEKFFAYVEYCTAKWRAGGDTTPFPSVTDPKTHRWQLVGFPCNTSLKWTLTYDPTANDGGVVTATIGEATAVCKLDRSHKSDTATFDHFGILNVIKSADAGSEFWLDDVVLNGGDRESFDHDPHWDGRNNRQILQSTRVRPRFDFGFSQTNFAGGKASGELGGLIFRGDCRYSRRMAAYGDRVGPLTLAKPLEARGKIAMTRGVTDSTTLFGFYNSRDSLRRNDSQNDAVPECVLGVHVEGPSRDGFHFYPVLRTKDAHGKHAPVAASPYIYPDGKSHDWTLTYDPAGASGKGRITVTLDGQSSTLDLAAGDQSRGTTFDRFGIVTPWIDGNSQDVYWDDLSYTVGQD
ncbi:MAG TPA: hypothetical protein VFG04_29615 [Planctomycetaceae bacterium]|jgi:hypothetical protein|nr:hypothetical protein [Planctomycetaceae bacterium]